MDDERIEMGSDSDAPRPRRAQRRSRAKARPARAAADARRRPRRRIRAALVALAVLAMLLAGVAAVGWNVFYRVQSDGEPGRPVVVDIPAGASTAQIAGMLADTGVVENGNMFRMQARLAEADGDLRAGSYDLLTGMGYDEVIETLRSGPEIVYYTVTIPEGFVVEQIAERIEAEVGIPAEEFLLLASAGTTEFPDRPYLASAHEGSLEGYLFPKTYRVREGSDARQVIEMMLDQFEKELEAIDLAAVEARGLSLHELVTIASIIEREARVAQDRPLVSSVIYNRLDRGMHLEICATIEYVLPGNRFRLTNEDLKLDSPYNSYMYGGLPPGPIASPGLAALQAAAGPAETDYVYYVLTSEDGSHTFTATWEEFERAKALSKEVFGR